MQKPFQSYGYGCPLNCDFRYAYFIGWRPSGSNFLLSETAATSRVDVFDPKVKVNKLSSRPSQKP